MSLLLNPRDFETRAREVLDGSVYDYYAGGAGDEITVRENEAAWARRRLVPRVLVDVSQCDLRTTVLGHAVSMPIITAREAPMRSMWRDISMLPRKPKAPNQANRMLSSAGVMPMLAL